ncbi:MAG: TIM barrel protein [Acidobacteriaceae bacterium]
MNNELSSHSTMSRRTLLLGAAMSSAWQAFAGETVESPAPAETESATGQKLKICVFSKHLQWTSISDAAAIARDIGFDGIDITVRAQGHVLPENVEKDLPAAVEAVHRAGLQVPMITTEIMSVDTPHADAVLKTAGKLGIHDYRWGFVPYPEKQGIVERLNELRPQVKALAELNEKHGICGMYHTHSGPGLVGAPIWDLWYLFQGLNPQWMGVNYDIGHATVEGGYGGWIDSSRLVMNQMKGIALKDFTWAQNKGKNAHADPYDKSLDIEDAWAPHWCGAGQGMVNFSGFFSLVKAAGRFSGPVQLHFEYPGLGGAENGKKTLTVPKEEVIAAMRRDLAYVRKVMSEKELI